MKTKYHIGDHGCPVNCRYCVITEVEYRRKMWNKKTIMGINKAATILNPPTDLNNKNEVQEFYNFPLELLRGDIVGFNALSDPFWPKYKKELDYFLKNVPQLAKLVVFVTKFPISDETFLDLKKIKNLRLNVSITGLDSLEKTKTRDRLLNLKKAKDYGIQALPVVHPYIAGMSDLSFLSELKKMGYKYIDVKGLRYDHKNMKEWMPKESQKYYFGQTGEILPEDGWREKIAESGLELIKVRDWYKLSMPKTPQLTPEEAQNSVNEILKFANITSSDQDQAVIQSAIKRRL